MLFTIFIFKLLKINSCYKNTDLGILLALSLSKWRYQPRLVSVKRFSWWCHYPRGALCRLSDSLHLGVGPAWVTRHTPALPFSRPWTDCTSKWYPTMSIFTDYLMICGSRKDKALCDTHGQERCLTNMFPYVGRLSARESLMMFISKQTDMSQKMGLF